MRLVITASPYESWLSICIRFLIIGSQSLKNTPITLFITKGDKDIGETEKALKTQISSLQR